MSSDFIKVVDCLGTVHIVRRDELAAGKAKLKTFYKSGKPIEGFPPAMRLRPAMLVRDNIASIAVRLRKRCALDDRIERKFRRATRATVAFC